jgi:pimeloyl-ACP methyl ester carboxylesterase
VAALARRQRPDGRWHWPFPADVNQLNRGEPTAADEQELRCAIAAPTLVVQAAETELFIGDAYSELAHSLADGRAALLPDAGHNLQWENVAGSADLVLDFLGR